MLHCFNNSRKFFSLSLNMKTVNQPVREGGDNERGNSNESESRKEGITGSKNLPGGGMKRIDWSHAAQNHGRVQKRIDPAQFSEIVITEHADSQGDADQKKRQQQMTSDPRDELCAA